MTSAPAANDGRDFLIMSVSLASGGFSSELRVPLPCSRAQQDKAVMDWLAIMRTGLNIGATEMHTVLTPPDGVTA
jgi:hypothetical protein